MEDIKHTDDRSVIKKAITTFVITMIFLTFFSKTIYNFMIPTVNITNPKSGELESEINGEGKVEAKEIQEFYIDQSLKVTAVNVKIGEVVKKGQVVMKVDTSKLEGDLQDELIILEQKKVRLEELSGNIEEKYNTEIKSLEDKISQAEEELRITKEIYKIGGESEGNLKKVERNLSSVKREYEKVLLDKQRKVKEQEVDIREAGLELKLHENKITNLKNEIDTLSKITAKTDGIVKEINFSEGTLTDSSKPLFTILDTSKGFQVKIPVNNKSVSYLNVGDDIEIKLKSIEENVTGNIIDIKNSLEHEQKKELTISLDSKELKGGEEVKIDFKKKSSNYDLLVPNEAVHEDAKGKFVLVVKSMDGPLGKEYYAQEARIVIGSSDNSNTVILDGTNQREQIIVSSDRPVSKGERIKIDEKK